MRPAWLLVLAAGCKGILGIDDPIVEHGPNDGPGPIDAPMTKDVPPPNCPAAPAGCAAYTCPNSTRCLYECGHDMRRTWSDANQFCVTNQIGCLVTVVSAGENSCIVERSIPSSNDPVWIGYVQSATGAEPAGGWGWSCGASTYVHWAITEPNQLTGDEDCADLKDNGGGWFDELCSQTYRFVCATPPP